MQVSGHGNFGSLDNDPPAAMRYTECRLQSVSSAVLLADLDFDTVDFAPNFDGSQVQSVCPCLYLMPPVHTGHHVCHVQHHSVLSGQIWVGHLQYLVAFQGLWNGKSPAVYHAELSGGMLSWQVMM